MTGSKHVRTKSSTPPSSGRARPRVLGLLVVLSFTLAAAGCGPSLKRVALPEEAVQAEREKQLEIALSTFMQRQERLFTVSYNVLVAGPELCGKDVRPTYGFVLHDKKRYGVLLGKEFEEAAARRGISDQVTLRYVHPQSPAASAGLKAGDVVLAINGQGLQGKTTVDALKIIQKLDASETRPVVLRIEREGQTQEVTIPGVPACNYPMVLVNQNAVNAFANGGLVVIFTGMVRFAEADKDLALVLGHEIAHNALGHIGKQRGNTLLGTLLDIAVMVGTGGIYTGGLFGNLAGRAFSKAFEAEADYAGLYIVARAGYDITDAATFWRRMAAEAPGSIKQNFLATHPSAPERFVAIEQTVREIEEKRRRGEPLLPDQKENRPEGETPTADNPDRAGVSQGTSRESGH